LGKVFSFAATKASDGQAQEKFPMVMASTAMDWPAPKYWDADELFLRVPGGSVSMIYADFSNLKTSFAVAYALGIAKAKGARVLYIVSEGAGFVGPNTLRGAFEDWNNKHPEDRLTKEWLDAHFRLIVKAPMLVGGEGRRLTGGPDMRILKRARTDWEPNIVILDTLGASASGHELGSMAVGTAIGASLRAFCQESEEAPYACDVLIVHHVGKDKNKGATGSQYFYNDADQALELTYNDGPAMTLEVKVTKARAGKKGRAVMFGVREVLLPATATQPGGKTVVVFPFEASDPRREVPKRERKGDANLARVVKLLQDHWPPGTLVTTGDLLGEMLIKEPSESEAQNAHTKENWRKNVLPRLAWWPGNKAQGVPGHKGPLYHLIAGVRLEQPEKPAQPFVFRVPAKGEDQELDQ
jgi:hypothetical protein